MHRSAAGVRRALRLCTRNRLSNGLMSNVESPCQACAAAAYTEVHCPATQCGETKKSARRALKPWIWTEIA